jgi:hypothetical protein
MPEIDPEVRAIAENYVKTGSNRRAVAAIRLMLEKGFVTTDDLNDLGYNHPPRAIGDVRDAGIPVITGSSTSERSGRRMAVYTLGQAKDIVNGRIGGRSALPKAFKEKLIAHYGSRDCITGAVLPPQVLQMDHRVPFRVSGDAGLQDHDVRAYMLLDASSQRAKSWSCENCRNFQELLKSSVCGTCYWAFPEAYDHIAMEQLRRTEISWQGDDVQVHDRLKARAASMGLTVGELLKQISRRA